MMKIDYNVFVANLVKDPSDILDSLDPKKANLIHAVFGISDEAGELLSNVKKHVIYGKPFDLDNLIEELGDLEFYLEQLRQEIKVSREEIIDKNISKLSKRYETLSYSDKAAIERVDKQ